ncbi:MAG: accessory factor UbiK family protein [Steroidobacter sp.]
MDVRTIDELASRLAASLPESVSILKKDVEQNFKAVLQSALTRMDLVSRQEFDVQVGLLNRVRTQLSLLEQRLAAMEHRDHSF